MIALYGDGPFGLVRLPDEDDLHKAVWIDLFQPTEEETARLATLGVEVPTLADMEEIEISNRLYREAGADYMIIVISGLSPAGDQVLSPVGLILTARQLVTVRHHTPRPFETFPTRAGKSATGCATADAVLLGLVEEILGRQADHLEAVGRKLDEVGRQVFGGTASRAQDDLEQALKDLVFQGEVISRVRLATMTLERAMAYFVQLLDKRFEAQDLKSPAKARLRDLQALEVHADFLAARLSFTTDTTLGVVNLQQTATARMLSTVAVLFLPPTLIASVFGMNFARLPLLQTYAGFEVSLVLMAGSAIITYAVFKWRGWL